MHLTFNINFINISGEQQMGSTRGSSEYEDTGRAFASADVYRGHECWSQEES